MNAPTERKVIASTGGSSAGITISTFLIWGIDELWFPVGEVPLPVQGMVFLIVTSGLTFISGWWFRDKKQYVYQEDYIDYTH